MTVAPEVRYENARQKMLRAAMALAQAVDGDDRYPSTAPRTPEALADWREAKRVYDEATRAWLQHTMENLARSRALRSTPEEDHVDTSFRHTSRPDARPSWDDLTPAERETERERGEDSEYFHDFTGWCADDCEKPQTKGEDGLGGCGHPVVADNERTN